MNGLGDTHNEYDTVVNQMLFQMHLWGFRADRVSPLTLTQQDQHVRDGTLPAMYLYDLIAQLAHEAHHRRMVAGGIVDGAAPTIMAPAAVINPPRL